MYADVFVEILGRVFKCENSSRLTPVASSSRGPPTTHFLRPQPCLFLDFDRSLISFPDPTGQFQTLTKERTGGGVGNSVSPAPSSSPTVTKKFGIWDFRHSPAASGSLADSVRVLVRVATAVHHPPHCRCASFSPIPGHSTQ